MKNSRIVTLATFAMVVFGGVETAFASMLYSFTTIDVPGASCCTTVANGINNSGQIVGYFDDTRGRHGFVDTGGSLSTIDVPGARVTQANGINDSGQIVGWFEGPGEGAFLATPVATPEPSSSLTLAPCLVALFAKACCRKRASGVNRASA